MSVLGIYSTAMLVIALVAGPSQHDQGNLKNSYIAFGVFLCAFGGVVVSIVASVLRGVW
jgi:hypothetical protein